MRSIPILIVDDNPTFLRIASRFLQMYCGDEVRVVGTANSGEKALEQARSLKPRVVLLDLDMPDTSGLDLIPRLRTALPEVGIIVLTLLDTGVYRQAAHTAGADDFVAKSVLTTDLLPAIYRLVQPSDPPDLPSPGWRPES